jgi:hypothetical protein
MQSGASQIVNNMHFNIASAGEKYTGRAAITTELPTLDNFYEGHPLAPPSGRVRRGAPGQLGGLRKCCKLPQWRLGRQCFLCTQNGNLGTLEKYFWEYFR